MEKRDYYAVLEIERDASEAAIKQAFRRLAMKYHPDRNPGDKDAAAKMGEINEAYAVLSDPQKRRQYDAYGHAGLEGYSTDDIFGGVDFGGLFREFGLGDIGLGGSIFDRFFGGRGAAEKRRRGADLRYNLEVTLEEVAFGAQKGIELPRMQPCKPCSGTGAKGGRLKTCERCKGSGHMVTEQRSGFSVFRQITTCGQCRGRGKTAEEPCDACLGKGLVEVTSEISVFVPPGADTGFAIRIEGEGEAGSEGAAPGDLYVVLHVKRHPVFDRWGDDLFITKEISFVQAALGDEVGDVPGLSGDLTIKIPEGTQTGAMFRVVGKGMPRPGGEGHGDAYVIVKVVTPRDLTMPEKELLRKFERFRKKSRPEQAGR